MFKKWGTSVSQVLASFVAAVGMCAIAAVPMQGDFGLSADQLLLKMIEREIPEDLKPVFERTYPDKSALVRLVREWQRASARLAHESSASLGIPSSPSPDEEWEDSTFARIFAELFCASDPALRSRVEESVGLGTLQEWATQLIAGRQFDESSGIVQWDRVEAPESLKKLGGFLVFVGSPGEAVTGVRICLGGGFHHYGIEVGPPGFEPAPSESWQYFRWADGVWGFQEK